MSEVHQQKRWHLENLLDKGMVMVHLDARHPGVRVPEEHRGEPHLRLNLSWRFDPCDMEIDDEAVEVTLTFGGRRFHCRLPFAAVFGMSSHASGESLVWIDDVPDEVLDALVPDSGDIGGPSASAGAERARLRSVEGGAAAPAQPTSSARSHLRVVK